MMKKFLWAITCIAILSMTLLVSGCKLFQSKEDKAREEFKKQLQKEDLDTSDLPSLEHPTKGADYPEFKDLSKEAEKNQVQHPKKKDLNTSELPSSKHPKKRSELPQNK